MWLFMNIHIRIYLCIWDPVVICQKKTEQRRMCAMSTDYKKEGLPRIHTVWADLLKCHPLPSKTDPLPQENSVTAATPPTYVNCPSAEATKNFLINVL